MVAKMFVLRVWYVYYTVQCGDAACTGAGNEIIINDNGWGYGEKRSGSEDSQPVTVTTTQTSMRSIIVHHRGIVTVCVLSLPQVPRQF